MHCCVVLCSTAKLLCKCAILLECTCSVDGVCPAASGSRLLHSWAFQQNSNRSQHHMKHSCEQGIVSSEGVVQSCPESIGHRCKRAITTVHIWPEYSTPCHNDSEYTNEAAPCQGD